MRLVQQSLFPTNVYHIDLPDSEMLNVYLKSRIYSLRMLRRKGVAGTDVRQMGAWQSDNNLFDYGPLKIFCDQIHSVMMELSQQRGVNPSLNYWCSKMWANISDRFGYGRTEYDLQSQWSGCYFVQTPNDCGDLIFYDPRNTHELQNNNQWDEPVSRHKAIAGRAYIFPSWLPCKIEANRSSLDNKDGDRIEIGFNFMVTEKTSEIESE